MQKVGNTFKDRLTQYDPSNSFCVDCNEPNPQYASINNGVLICGKCSIEHDKLGYQISYIRDINADWDGYLFGFIRHGGNKKFKENLVEFHINNIVQGITSQISLKYQLKAVEYYRLNLKAKLYGSIDVPKKPSIDEAKMEMETNNDNYDYYPEFVKYQFVVENKGIDMLNEEEKSFGDKVNCWMNKVKSMTKVLGNTMQKMKFRDTMNDAFDFTKNSCLLLKDKISSIGHFNADENGIPQETNDDTLIAKEEEKEISETFNSLS